MKKRKKNILAAKAVMLNNWKAWEDSSTVRVSSERILHYWAEPSEESESRDSSPLSLGARSVIVRWALCLGGGASRGTTGVLGVEEGAPGVEQMTVEGPAWSSARSMLSCTC